MAIPKIKTGKRIRPMIYAYTTPNDISHEGWTKIGYTASQTVEDRIKEQTHTVDAKVELLWKGSARYQDGSDELFTDHEFHNYLTTKRHVQRKPSTEWFKINGDLSHQCFYKFAERDFSDLKAKDAVDGSQYELRKEQGAAVEQTMNHFIRHGEGSEFLWNAKPRFGKTLTTYDLARQMKLRNVLVVTNRPSIANSWFDDYEKFIGWQTKYYFVSETDALKERAALSRQEYLDTLAKHDDDANGQIAFESLQGLKGAIYFCGDYDKLKWIADTEWDLLVIDEAHEGVDTYKTDKAFDRIKRKYTLHLSGTPFKALANGKFASNQIYNWSYADEQTAKQEWDEDVEGSSNPYEKLPRLNMFTYQMSAIMEEKAKQGMTLDGDTVDPAFDLNEFFKTNSKGEFVYDTQVDHFLDALTTQEKFPFSTPELRDELKHTFWLLNRVDSAKALAKKLKDHPVFGEYEVVLAAGDGSLDEDVKESKKAFDRVQEAIEKYDKTITLSVGQLTTGVTVKPWTAVMMLSSMKSPSEYMQAAFRAQNPYIYQDESGKSIQKENAYVFDFDPTRTLTIFDEFANNLSADTARGNGTAEQREENIRRLLNFFPVIGEDEEGKMVELDPKQVLSIPRRLKSQEVVNHGFMNNFLFTNISNIFNAPAEVKEILNGLVTAREDKNKKRDVTVNDTDDVNVDDNGNVVIDNERVIGKATEIFGNKIFEAPEVPETVANDDANKFIEDISDVFNKKVTSAVVNEVKGSYKLNQKQVEKLQADKKKEIDANLHKHADKFNDEKRILENERQKQLDKVTTKEEMDGVQSDFESKLNQAMQTFQSNVQEEMQKQISSVQTDMIERVEKHEAEVKKNTIEEDARAHLRGFSRTIPSFIMAYGDQNLTLQNFDDYTEDDVFQEVTGISEEQFRFLRDGGDYVDAETGEKKHFEGHLFDEVVFNDSIQEFLNKREALSNYFDESNDEDIFDYIPPQKTNQIYTPKAVVKHMVDDLEDNNPGIFDDPNKTFADLYMKSGLYITEIVKRLFRSEKMKELYPDDNERIKHIMEHQVYGFAPTRIIYLIATNYIFGFNDEIKQSVLDKHFKMKDTAEYAKNGELEDLIQEEFGGKNY
ncbi:DEAD/DEAH box helicase family protein [Limosilactobacillus fermentum]|uniref:DEAD/DEAH box helicase family protein n=1 Tax=Limosilactobacillus fermentum TaxID=1613 RepID=UPI0021E751AD|nr:DEAD/DEAH box helicase family protein [Limosilactobacillus fermentum]MCV3756093.1 DEAD/DEAH box helicase family protein [Limosilactobacillus fermentum]